MLAGLEQPLDGEEVRRLFAACFVELGIKPLQAAESIRFFTRSVLSSMIRGELTRKAAMQRLSDLCVALGYERELMDFYLLFYAMSDLETQQLQWYWKGANRSNIFRIIDERSKLWLERHRNIEAA